MSFIKNNQVIDVISPATACSFAEMGKIKFFLKEKNLNANFFDEEKLTLATTADHEFPSFSAKARFEQFKKAIENPNSKIIWCTRGGYGSAELLPFLYKMPKPKNKKILIGFSDISSLNNFLIEKWNWQIISAPVLIQLALEKVSKESENAIFDLLEQKNSTLKYQVKLLTEVKKSIFSKNIIKGDIVGGCISVLSGNFATKNQINWKNKILFLEDEGEDGERLDRYFQQIFTIMLEQKNFPKAILLGNFLEANPHGTPKAKNIEIAIERLVKRVTENKINLPIFQEISGCLGHSKNMLPLVLGKEAVISDGFLIQKF